MKSVYFVFAHPHRNRSRVNATVLETVSNLNGVTVCDLYERYPSFALDIDHEKRELLRHEVIFFQHPLYWYSLPPLLKLWFDEVFELGFAYGPGGTHLAGKDFQVSVSAGGPESAYGPNGYNQYSIDEFFVPYRQIATLCTMKWSPPIVLYQSNKAKLEAIEAHAERVRDRVLRFTNPLYAGPTA